MKLRKMRRCSFQTGRPCALPQTCKAVGLPGGPSSWVRAPGQVAWLILVLFVFVGRLLTWPFGVSFMWFLCPLCLRQHLRVLSVSVFWLFLFFCQRLSLSLFLLYLLFLSPGVVSVCVCFSALFLFIGVLFLFASVWSSWFWSLGVAPVCLDLSELFLFIAVLFMLV